ncbi:50S ribosomal protein L23 [Candidatus Dependentiae bacterium]|nr:50S ribosomal protein L23 [Candidatus Dependentiae bacterium]
MELSIYDIIKKPVITTKSVMLFQKAGKITFEVNLYANKLMVRRAVEKIWNVEVDSIRMMIRKGKNKSYARRPFATSDSKRAIITLKQGYKINLPSMFETMGVEDEANVQMAEAKE